MHATSWLILEKMFLLLLIFAASLFLTWVYVRWSKVKRYWADRGVPFVPPNPLLGNLTFLQRYNSGIWMRNLYHNYRTPYVGIWLFWRPALVVNSVEIGRRILISDATNFRDRLVTSGDSDPIGKHNLFTVKEPVWSSLRRRLTLVFTAAKLRSMHGLVEMKTRELVQRIQNDMTESKCVNLRKAFTDYTTDVIGGASLGFVGEATLTGRGPLRTVTQQFMDYDFFRGVSWLLMFFWPTWVNFFGLTAFPKTSIDILKRVYQTALAQRGGYDNEVKETRDLLDALIKIKQDCARDNEDMPEEKLIAHAAVFVQGGFDTTASILSWCVYELAFHPEIQENMYNELLELQKYEEKLKDIDAGSLSNLSYMNAVLDETLRKYVPMGWIDRVAAQDYQMDERLTVPAGTPVYVNAVGIQSDPDIFPEPDNFRPERFLESDVNRGAMPVWTFGEGPRSCIGRRFALINLRCALAYMVVTYKFRPLATTPPPARVQVERHSLFYSPGEPLLIEFEHRT